MTAKLQRCFRQLPATEKVNRLPLNNCLKRLGVKPSHGQWFNLSHMDTWQLQDLFGTAHKVYRRMMVVVHPDRGGDQQLCSRLTALWARIKFLFARKGITA